jgi:pimeloyl-ACP methyl ester carboxylesterase
MTRPLRVLAVASAIVAASCAHPASERDLEAHTLRNGDALPVHATYFAARTPRAHERRTPIVVVEPILFRRELLYAGPDGGGLVSSLRDEGFAVWLVGASAPALPDARALGRGIAQMVTEIARETGVRSFDLIGSSLGSEAALYALDRLTAPDSPVSVRCAAFVGGGFDFAYPNSFARREAHVGPGEASRLCTQADDPGCMREFHRPADAMPWLGALPPVAADDLEPSDARFAFVRGFSHLPVLFVTGKSDGIAPSESAFPLYEHWGADARDSRAVPKLFFQAGLENELGRDLDHFELFAGRDASRVAHIVARWLARAD